MPCRRQVCPAPRRPSVYARLALKCRQPMLEREYCQKKVSARATCRSANSGRRVVSALCRSPFANGRQSAAHHAGLFVAYRPRYSRAHGIAAKTSRKGYYARTGSVYGRCGDCQASTRRRRRSFSRESVAVYYFKDFFTRAADIFGRCSILPQHFAALPA